MIPLPVSDYVHSSLNGSAVSWNSWRKKANHPVMLLVELCRKKSKAVRTKVMRCLRWATVWKVRECIRAPTDWGSKNIQKAGSQIGIFACSSVMSSRWMEVGKDLDLKASYGKGSRRQEEGVTEYRRSMAPLPPCVCEEVLGQEVLLLHNKKG